MRVLVLTAATIFMFGASTTAQADIAGNAEFKRHYKASKVSARRSRCRHRAAVVASAKRYRVPVRLALAVAVQESGCRWVRGRAGEYGPLQILPPTARLMARTHKECRSYKTKSGSLNCGMLHLRIAYQRSKGSAYGAALRHNGGWGAKKGNKDSRKYAANVMRIMRKF
ncbi:MAG: transglycosylase SLT domain-containing protein [Aestuariivirgaceae bacterium]